LGVVSSANFLISASTSGCTGSDLSGADVGAFITVSGPLIGSSHPFPNHISSRVKKALGFFFNEQPISSLARCSITATARRAL
jgi:hypothetical protein